MKKNSFTLIEIVVVIGVIGFVLPALFAIVFSILQQQSSIYNLMEVKRQGDNALVTMENIIRNNALKIYEKLPFEIENERCKNGGNKWPPTMVPVKDGRNLYFQDKNGVFFRFYFSDNKISSHSAIFGGETTIDLTNSKVIISDFQIFCERLADYSTPIVSVKFTVKSGQTSQYPMNYYTKIKLKNY